MEQSIRKITIVGGPGTGKTTLARNLGQKLNLPVYHLDGIDHLENWEKRPVEERDRIILEKVNEEKWVTDGTYIGTLEARVLKSDMIIFLRYSTFARVKGIFSRYFKIRGQERKEIPGCKEQMNLEFIKFAIKWNKEKANKVNEILEKHKDKNIIILKNRRALNKWYSKNFNEKININI